MAKFSLGILVPSYRQFDYVSRTIVSAFEHSPPDTRVLLIDDGSPDWIPHGAECLIRNRNNPQYRDRLLWSRFFKNGGYIRSLNEGINMLTEAGAEYICCANSDLLFSPGWEVGQLRALNDGFDLVGPVTNAPGSEEQQQVSRYVTREIEKWVPSDAPDEIDEIAEALEQYQQGIVLNGTINGFCMMAKTKTWWDHAYDPSHVFCPRNDFNSQGQPNPTPLMTLNEYELQRRWHAAGLRSGICLDSYVFHYRSVSRGEKYRKGQGFRAGT